MLHRKEFMKFMIESSMEQLWLAYVMSELYDKDGIALIGSSEN